MQRCEAGRRRGAWRAACGGRGLIAGASAVLVALVALGCERTPVARDDRPRPPRDARAPADAAPGRDASLRDTLDGLEPLDPPPPPIVRNHRYGDCRPAYAPRPTRDPNPMCKVDGGTFTLSEDAAAAAGIPRRVTVRGFYIDQFEVTARQAVRFLNAHGNACVGYDHPDSSYCVFQVDGGPLDVIRRRNDRFEAVAGDEDRPARFTVEGGLRYCAWAGKVMPSEAQWEFAARHDPRNGKDYRHAWGNTWDPDRAYLSDDQGPFLPGQAMPVGSFDGTGGRPDGSSPWGLHDVVGNLSEHAFRCEAPDASCSIGCRCTRLRRGLSNTGDLTARGSETRPDVGRGWGGVSAVRCLHPEP